MEPTMWVERSHDGRVALVLDPDGDDDAAEETGMILDPDQARQLAMMLTRMAYEIEDGAA